MRNYRRLFTFNHLHFRAYSIDMVDPYTQRFRSTQFVGRYKEDILLFKDSKIAKDLAKRARNTFVNRDNPSFKSLARETTAFLGSISQHPLYIPPYLAFIEDPSPFAPCFDSCMSKVFDKAYDTARSFGKDKELTKREYPNNQSGLAISAPRGVGITTGMKICSIVAPFLLPNVLSVYFDYQSALEPPYPSEIIKEAAKATFNLEIKSTGINTVLQELSHHGISCMFVADEIRIVYENKHIWSELHNLVTSMYHTIFLSDSTSCMKAMIESSNEQLLKELGFHTKQQPLNGSKISLFALAPFTNKQQYHSYLEKCDISPQGWNIEGLHSLTGGRLRDIKAILQNDNGFRALQNFPEKGSIDLYLLEKLAEKQTRSGNSFPFDTVDATETEIHNWIADAVNTVQIPPTETPYTIIHRLVNDCTLQKQPDKGSYTFGTPSHYRSICAVRPSVFISHAMTDYPQLGGLISLLKNNSVEVVLGEAHLSKSAMVETGLDRWMNNETELVSRTNLDLNHFIFIALSDDYVQKALVPGTGCHTELYTIAEQVKRDPKLNSRVILVRVSEKSDPSQLEQNPSFQFLQQAKYILNLHDPEELPAVLSAIFGFKTDAISN
eukprot:TRINITY_DN1484_c0_g1_i1.p1 TRINITY_DN1484_c0_g1~~TRINITY_DN1484_c0_g1_i1.p1  ORF type:complete len:610 (-),score=31.90 TRINITY_DN1484_c0_g1_i1:44-1873(-)